MSEALNRHVLVVANRTCPCPALLDEIAKRDGAVVLIVAPALNTRLRHWVSDSDRAAAEARLRLDEAITALAGSGVTATGEVGDADPLVAMADVLTGFAADEIIISTHPPGQSNWLERELPQRAREQFRVEVTHLVSRMGAESPAAA